MLKMGIVGLGKMGEFHVDWMTPENQLQLVAACEKNKARVKELKKKYDVRFYTEIDEFLDKEKELDFAVIVTTHEHELRKYSAYGGRGGKEQKAPLCPSK